jgi:hypothetical protein
MLLNKAIHDTLHIPYEQIESAWRTQQLSDEAETLREVSIDLTPEAARYLCLQKLFVMERNRHQLRQSDIAGIMGVDETTVSNAERDRGESVQKWPSYFQSRHNVTTYSNGDADSAKQLELAAHSVCYPKGIRTLTELVQCIAAKYDTTVPQLGKDILIDRLSDKLYAGDTLSVTNRLKLHAYLAKAIQPLEHLGINARLLERLLPDPQRILDDQNQSFRDVLNQWAQLATGTTVNPFAQLVGEVSGKNYTATAVYRWGSGIGLVDELPHIIQVLESNPNTKDLFPACKATFLTLAQQALEPKERLNLSAQLLKAKTLSSILATLEKNPTTPLTGAQITLKLNIVYGHNYGAEDYEQWKTGNPPKDTDFPKHIADTLCSLIEQTSGAELNDRARRHLTRLAAGKPSYRDRSSTRQV